jgi:hypothetical protein
MAAVTSRLECPVAPGRIPCQGTCSRHAPGYPGKTALNTQTALNPSAGIYRLDVLRLPDPESPTSQERSSGSIVRRRIRRPDRPFRFAMAPRRRFNRAKASQQRPQDRATLAAPSHQPQNPWPCDVPAAEAAVAQRRIVPPSPTAKTSLSPLSCKVPTAYLAPLLGGNQTEPS